MEREREGKSGEAKGRRGRKGWKEEEEEREERFWKVVVMGLSWKNSESTKSLARIGLQIVVDECEQV